MPCSRKDASMSLAVCPASTPSASLNWYVVIGTSKRDGLVHGGLGDDHARIVIEGRVYKVDDSDDFEGDYRSCPGLSYLDVNWSHALVIVVRGTFDGKWGPIAFGVGSCAYDLSFNHRQIGLRFQGLPDLLRGSAVAVRDQLQPELGGVQKGVVGRAQGVLLPPLILGVDLPRAHGYLWCIRRWPQSLRSGASAPAPPPGECPR